MTAFMPLDTLLIVILWARPAVTPISLFFFPLLSSLPVLVGEVTDTRVFRATVDDVLFAMLLIMLLVIILDIEEEEIPMLLFLLFSGFLMFLWVLMIL